MDNWVKNIMAEWTERMMDEQITWLTDMTRRDEILAGDGDVDEMTN